MRFVLFFYFLFLFKSVYSEDYIIEFQAKVKNLKEYKISNVKQFRNYDLEGTFTDNFGNYGKFNAIIISDVENGKLIRLDSTGENIYANNEKVYFRGIREKSDIDAGIAYNLIIGATNKLKPLVGTTCTTSVRYFDDAIFGINKCKLSKELNKLFSDIN